MERLNEGITYVLWQLQHQVRQRLTQQMSALGLSLAQLSALARLADEPGLSSADLARHLLLTPQAVSLMTSRLAAHGYLERGPRHGRRRSLTPTAAGLDAVRQAVQGVHRVHDDVFADLTAEEQATLHRLLSRALQTARRA